MQKIIYLSFLFIFLPIVVFSQNYKSHLTTLTTEDGLSSNEVLSIHKDARGFMWIGTQFGLNRFDGKNFKVYTRENIPNLEFEVVNKIMGDGEENLWLVKTHNKYEHHFTEVNINVFNIKTEEVLSFQDYIQAPLPFDLKEVSFIKQLADQSIFIHCQEQQQTFIYRSGNGFTSLKLPHQFKYVSNVLLKKNGHFLVCPNLGGAAEVYEINMNGEIIDAFLSGIDFNTFGENEAVTYTTWGKNNLNAFENRSWKKKDLTSSLSIDVSNQSILQTDFNPYQKLFWLRTNQQIMVTQPDGQIIFDWPEVVETVEPLPIFFDKKTTWVSNGRDGLLVVTLQPNHFQTYQPFKNSVSNSMRGMIKDRRGKFWFSTIHGIGKMDAQLENLQFKKTASITNFLEDKKGNIWFVENTDLVHYEVERQKTKKYRINIGAIPWSIFEAQNGEIWINTKNGFCYAFDPGTGQFYLKTSFPKTGNGDFNIYHFEEKNESSVWVCTNQGLFLVDLTGKILATFNEQQEDKFYLPANDFHHLYQEKNDKIWVATGDAGLFELSVVHDDAQQKLVSTSIKKQYTFKNGLSSNSLHAVYADAYDYLWMSSDEGLMQLDKRSGYITKYYKSQGIADNEFNRIAHHQSADGQLFFGGIDGFTFFDPKDFAYRREELVPPVLAIAEFQQFSGEEKKYNDLTAELTQSQQIVLGPNDQFIQLQLALLDFGNSSNGINKNQHNIFHYRIQGLYDWRSTESGDLSFNSLPYGNHVLEIKAQNGNLQNSENTLKIDIRVLSPFYLQWWFFLLSIVGVGAVVFFLVKRRTRQIIMQKETQQLRSLDQMKSHFFANISHELRTPLTLVGLPLEHLIKNYQDFSEEEVLQYLKSAYSNKENLNRLVDEILALSKLEAGKLELEKEVTPLHHFLSRTVRVFETSAQSKQVKFYFTSTIEWAQHVELDVKKMEMVINNLLNNAIKFTPEKGVINIDAHLDIDDNFYFTVEDNGRGIHPDDLPNIFNRYFQSTRQENKLEGGSGIGLAICREMIELMRGEIEVESKLNQGSIFRFRIPINRVAKEIGISENIQVENKVSSDLFEARSEKFSKKKSTILIVEDHIEMHQYLRNTFSKVYNVLSAKNGEEALQLLPTADCQLIISDVMMPKMDGFTFLEKVKSHDQFCGIPFILLTARADIQDKLKGLRIGVDAYLTKPFEMEELQLCVKNLISNVRNRSQVEEDVSPPKTIKPREEQPTKVVRKEELEWLKKVETIALREVKNSEYSVNDLSRDLLLSRSQLFRRIKEITGQTPKKYLNTVRLQKAKQLLESGEIYTLTEVCLDAGFNNTTHFSNMFEKEFGRRPHVFLRQSRI